MTAPSMASMGCCWAGTSPHSASKARGAPFTAPPVSSRTAKSANWMQLPRSAWYGRDWIHAIACRRGQHGVKRARELRRAICREIKKIVTDVLEG